jgi:hypothetical protein
VQLFGIKVLFSQLGAERNRECFKDSHGTAHHLQLGEGISKMMDFKVTILMQLIRRLAAGNRWMQHGLIATTSGQGPNGWSKEWFRFGVL